jgi:glutamate-1-semialdehyde 2,1-aminomutase
VKRADKPGQDPEGGSMAEPGWWERAVAVIPGGVNSPVRSFRGVGGEPFLVQRGAGARLEAVDGRQFIDYVMSYGPLILGHAHAGVVRAAQEAAAQGLSFGAPTPLEVRLAEKLVDALPGLEMVRMVNSGTEATMAALRVARAATGRSRVVKFTGCYHGHHDSLLIRAGSGAATLGVPDSAGVPGVMAELTIALPYNDRDALAEAFRRWGPDIAAVIVEPVAGNMGTVLPAPGFLEDLRALTRATGALLVMDEVMTGFRVAWGGAQVRYGIEPDLTCLAKVIGGGLPVAAYGGRRDLMEWVAPLGPVYQAGTLSGNPVGMAAGLAQLDAIGGPEFYGRLEASTRALADGLQERAARRGQTVTTVAVGGMLSLFFASAAPQDFDAVMATDTDRFRRFFHAMLEAGVFWPPSPFETAFLSAAHDAAVIDETLAAADRAFASL